MDTSNNVFNTMGLPKVVDEDNQFFDWLYGKQSDLSTHRIEYTLTAVVDDVQVYSATRESLDSIEEGFFRARNAVENEIKELVELESNE